ncbi:MAG: hypothetical protein V3V11_09835, partial [Vicinamibacteria bacterium]
MSQRFDQLDNRRQFLRFMAASPLLVHGAPGWLQLGDDGTLRANREGFKKFQLRVRRLIDVSMAAVASVSAVGGAASAPVAAAYHQEVLGPIWIMLALIG